MVVTDSSSGKAVSDAFIDCINPVDILIDWAIPELASCSYGLPILERTAAQHRA